MILRQHLRMRAAALASALVLLPASQPALAINQNAGTTGFNFLKIPVGARPTSLGGAYAAVAGEMEATAFNPAGLHGLEQRAGVVSFASYLVDTEAGFIGVALPGESRVWAGSVNYFSYGSMRHTDADGQDLGSFRPFEFAASVTAAQRVWRRLAVGASLKAIYSSIQDYTSDAYALDLGILADGPIRGMKLGFSISNMGGVRSGYTGGFKDSLPVVMRVGISHRPAHAPLPLILLADANVPNDGDPFFAFGAELQVGDRLFLRPGYSLQQTGAQGEEAIGLTAGAGVLLQRYRLGLRLRILPLARHRPQAFRIRAHIAARRVQTA